MRVLMTTDTVGGVWTFTKELVMGLLECGSLIALVSVGRKPNAAQIRWASEMEQEWEGRFYFRATEVPLEWMQENDRAYRGAAAYLTRLAEEFKAEVFHSNQFCFGTLPISIPKVVTAHSDVLSWAKSCKVSALAETPWLRQYCKLVGEGLKGADVLVAPTQWMLDAVGEHFSLPHRRSVISNGRSVSFGAPRARKLQAVTAGRLWDEAKGIDLLRDVTSPFPMMVAGHEVCGDVTAPMNVGQAQRLGELKEENLIALFRESAIYLCLSRYEPFGLAPLEAALCGCAVVANDLPSLREVWQDGAMYFDSADSLSTTLRALQRDGGMLQEAQERSFLRAQRYSRKAMTALYAALFEKATTYREDMADVA